MEQALYTSTTISFVLTTLFVLFFRPLASKIGLVDIPNERKVHIGEVPLVGGIAIFSAVFIAHVSSIIFTPISDVVIDYGTFYTAGGLLLVVGMIDDFHQVSPTNRLISEIIGALLICLSAGVIIYDLGNLVPGVISVELGVLATPFTVFCTVGVINAINMSDGLDGLAGGLTLVTIGGFIVATVVFGNGDDLLFLSCLAASICAFMLFNVTVPGVRRALIFLGDSGSMFLGLAIAWIAIRFSQGPDAVISPAATLWFVALPIYDSVCMTGRRILRKRPIFGADKEHLHHVFLLAGFTVTETVMIMAGLAAVGVAVGLLGTFYSVPDWILASSFLIVGLLYFWTITRAWTVMRFMQRSICRRRNIVDRRQCADRRRHRSAAYKGSERRRGIDRRSSLRRKVDTSEQGGIESDE
jgi:UDP-GlcNAc:undecaprenyl-phosphate GlcNAc-1-phosphate transferase